MKPSSSKIPCRGKFSSRRDSKTLAAFISSFKLRDALINGDPQRKSVWCDQRKREFDRISKDLKLKFGDLNDRKVEKECKSRTCRSIADKASSALRMCRKLRAAMQVAARLNSTGISGEDDMMRSAIVFTTRLHVFCTSMVSIPAKHSSLEKRSDT